MGCQCAPALRRLQSEINDRWPGRDKASDGCCGDAAHAARKSDHNAAANGYAHAVDIDENLTPDIGSLDFLIPILLADSRTKYVIYEGRIHYPPATSKPYTGVNAHKQHLHLSIKPTATFETRLWLPPIADQEDDMPSLDEIETRMIAVLDKMGVSGSDRRDAAILAAIRDIDSVTAADMAALIPDGIAADVADILSKRLEG